MSNPIDPFEEYLRKKKVEMLEAKYRGEKRPDAAPAQDGQVAVAPEQDEASGNPDDKLKEEMDDFFESGTEAGAQYFSRSTTELTEDKVEEIRGALDDVFEEDAPAPRTAPDGETFVNFFQQVQQTYDGDALPPVGPTPEEPEEERPLPPPPELTPRHQMPAPPAPAVDPAAPVAVPEPDMMVVEDLEAPQTDPAATRRLNLADILLGSQSKADLDQKVEVLCRIVARLVERSNLPESEIIEALIKSEVEF